MRFGSLRRVVAAAAVMVLVAACASVPPATPPSGIIDVGDTPFSIGGRISARRGDAGIAGSFTWIHDAAHDAIDLSSPLGQMLAKLEGGPDGVLVHLPDGRTRRGSSWQALTEDAFGVTIPVDGLAAWVRAAAVSRELELPRRRTRRIARRRRSLAVTRRAAQVNSP